MSTTSTTITTGPLAGIKVFDVSQGAVGPWAGSLLGQMGADVLKVESPAGDFIRAIMPAKKGLSTTYISSNSSKRGVTLDLKQKADRETAHALMRQADVFIENFRPGVADRLGIGYHELAAINPRLIYVSASGFGPVGPMVALGATDPHVQAFAGTCSVNGQPGGLRQRWRWYGHFDNNTAIHIVQSVLAALFERERTGKGQYIEVTMVEAALDIQRVRISEHLAGGKPAPMGSATTYLVPDQSFATQDKPIAVSVTSPRQWRGFCEAIGKPELADDPRFARNPQRVEHRAELIPILEAVFKARPMQHWLERLRRANVPCAGFTSFDDYRWHVHYIENGMVRMHDTVWGRLCLCDPPWTFTKTPASIRPAAQPGEHTREVIDGGWPAPANVPTRTKDPSP
jgi:crotonobetainyl-CoA:carnitine CoA-transferase CaiB-like acyl-CoA transferase